MKFELLKEMVDSGYNSEDINELYEFCIDYILEYEHIIERSALKRQLNALKKAKGGTEKGTKLLEKIFGKQSTAIPANRPPNTNELKARLKTARVGAIQSGRQNLGKDIGKISKNTYEKLNYKLQK